MTTFIGSVPVETQIRSLASFLESAAERRESANKDATNTNAQENQQNQESQAIDTKTTQSQFSLKVDELTTKKDSEKALLEVLREPLTETLIKESSEKDVESFFLVTFSIVRNLTSGSRQELVSKILSILSSTTPLNTKAQLRLSLINTFYNSLLPSQTHFGSSSVAPAPSKSKGKGTKAKKNTTPQQPTVDFFSTNFTERLETLRSLMSYAYQTNQSQVITPLIPQILSWIKSWHTANPSSVPLQDYQSLFTLLLSHVPSDSPLSFTLRLQHLNSFTNSSNDYGSVLSADSGVKNTVIELIKEIINNEERIAEIEELKEVPVVQSLVSQSSDIERILTMLSSGTLKDTQDERVRGFVDSIGVDRSKLRSKMQLLELTRLGQAGKEVSYEEVRDRLELESGAGWEDSVESLIITAISVGVIEARLDQLRRVVIVDRVAQREFGREQWEQIGSKLTGWRKNVSDLLAMIENRKTAAAS